MRLDGDGRNERVSTRSIVYGNGVNDASPSACFGNAGNATCAAASAMFITTSANASGTDSGPTRTRSSHSSHARTDDVRRFVVVVGGGVVVVVVVVVVVDVLLPLVDIASAGDDGIGKVIVAGDVGESKVERGEV